MLRKSALLAAMTAVLAAGAAASAQAASTFQPRVANALGLFPAFGQQTNVATGALTPPVYHGGLVMNNGVEIHVIYWTPSGFTFGTDGPDGTINTGYEHLVNQWFADVAAASSPTASNIYSTLTQYGDVVGGVVHNGDYSITSATPIIDTDPYPTSDQCASPDNIGVCLTDGQIQAEINSQIGNSGERGLTNLWFVFLPPGVDECITPGVCGTTSYAAYHSDFDLSSNAAGLTIYGVVVDPIIEATIAPGGDPEGNPYAEGAIDSVAHETEEAMTDPEGVGWLDPNGFEVADKCEFGPQLGTPLGYATDGSPYNQLVNGHEYLIQEMFSDTDGSCVQSTSPPGGTTPLLPLPQVNLTQFSSTVTGNIGSPTAGVTVNVALARGDEALDTDIDVKQVTTTTNAQGAWSVSLAPFAVGDDRDEIDITYSGSGAPASPDVIMTGNGGNPFTESGWTGWFDLDTGFTVNSTDPAVTLGPCFQTGVLGLAVNGTSTETPTDFCNTQTDTSEVPTSDLPFGAIALGDTVTMSSNDNRGFVQDTNGGPVTYDTPTGALVNLQVTLGEPDAFPEFFSGDSYLSDGTDSDTEAGVPTDLPTGLPACTADLEAGTVTCSGVVPDDTYTLTRARGAQSLSATASAAGLTVGTVTFGPFPGAPSLQGGDTVTLNNGFRDLTTLHVANLVAKIQGEQNVLASGSTCQPGLWYGPGLSAPPISTTAAATDGSGADLTGTVCPLNGDASGLPDDFISQTDDASGGSTQTELADIEDTSPSDGQIVYGSFTALATAGFPSATSGVNYDTNNSVAVGITPTGSNSVVFSNQNVNADTTGGQAGATVGGLAPGQYTATWTWSDATGDTRTVITRFIEASPVQGPAGTNGSNGSNGSNGAQGPAGTSGPTGPTGPKGATGAKGSTGARGPAGALPSVTCKLKAHGKITCKVTVAKTKKKSTLMLSLTRGLHVGALGHSTVKGSTATVSMRELSKITRGTWTVTLVLAQPKSKTKTYTDSVRIA